MLNSSLIAIIKAEVCTCAAMRPDGTVFYRESGIGVKPLVTPMRIDRAFFKDAQVADKVIGRAAALLLVLSGASAVYGAVMSRTAMEILDRYGVPYEYGSAVPYITNRTGDGLCPLEQCVLGETCPETGWEKITRRIAELMKK